MAWFRRVIVLGDKRFDVFCCARGSSVGRIYSTRALVKWTWRRALHSRRRDKPLLGSRLSTTLVWFSREKSCCLRRKWQNALCCCASESGACGTSKLRSRHRMHDAERTPLASIGLASDDVRKPSNAWQRGKLVLNKDCVPYKSMLGEKSFAVRSSLFFRREVWTALTTLSQLCASHIKRFRRSDKWGAVFRSIDDFPAWFCMGRCLCLEPILPVATPVAALWRSTCKPYIVGGFKNGSC